MKFCIGYLHIWKPFAIFAYANKNPMEQTAKPKFRIIYSTEAISFIESLSEKVQDKIAYNIEKSMYHVDKEIFKKLKGSDIWEFRTLFNGICYRLFAFWDTDKDALVIATHGVVKKAKKTPLKEIEKAEAIRKEYFNNKK